MPKSKSPKKPFKKKKLNPNKMSDDMIKALLTVRVMEEAFNPNQEFGTGDGRVTEELMDKVYMDFMCELHGLDPVKFKAYYDARREQRYSE